MFSLGHTASEVIQVEYIILIWRTVLFYTILLISLRLLGKREVGNLSVFDVVVFLMIAEVAAETIHKPTQSVWTGIFPVAVLAIIQISVALLSLKNKRVRDLLEGEPALMIRDGVIQETVMRKHRYNLDDLFQQLREQQVGSVEEVAYAYLEASGKLAIFQKSQSPLTIPVIMDGEIQQRHLHITGHTEQDLLTDLAAKGISSATTIFYATYLQGELKYQLKESAWRPSTDAR